MVPRQAKVPGGPSNARKPVEIRELRADSGNPDVAKKLINKSSLAKKQLSICYTSKNIQTTIFFQLILLLKLFHQY